MPSAVSIGKKVNAGEPGQVARHQEPPRRQARKRKRLLAAFAQILREQLRALLRGLLVLRRQRIDGGEKLKPIAGRRRARAFAGQRNGLPRPLLVAQIEQRQVEQPFARIIHDVDVERVRAERAPNRIRRLVFDGEAQLADLPRALGPARLGGRELGEVPLIVEARHRVVRLRLQIGADDARLRQRLEEGQPVAGDEVVDQRGDEHRLARARQPGYAEPQRGREEVARRRLARAPMLPVRCSISVRASGGL